MSTKRRGDWDQVSRRQKDMHRQDGALTKNGGMKGAHLRGGIYGRWSENAKGNFSTRTHGLHVQVFAQDGGWRFMRAQIINGRSGGRSIGQLSYRFGKRHYDGRLFATKEEAMAAALDFQGGASICGPG